MKNKIYFLAGFFAIVTFVIGASSFTTYYNLEKPADGDSNWGEAFRDNMDIVDSQMSINATSIDNHVVDAVAAHAASAISSDVGGNVCIDSEDVQTFLECLDTNINTLSGGGAVSITGTQTITGDKTFTAATSFTGGIVSTGNLSESGSVTFSGLSTGLLHADSAGSITSSTLVDADVSATAQITRTKLATGTASHVMVNDGSGDVTSEAQLAPVRGGTGQDFSASSGVIKATAGTFSAGSVDLTADVTGVLPSANGGSGIDASGVTNGQLLIGNTTGNVFALGTLTGTTDQVTVTNGASSVTLSTPQSINTTSSPTFVSTTLNTSLIMGDTGGGSETVTIQAPADADLTSSYTLTLPVDDGTTGQALKTDGSGVLTWGAAGGFPDGSTTQTITSGGTITISTSDKAQVVYARGDTASTIVAASTTPFGATPPGDNSEVVLCGRDDTQPLSISYNDAADGLYLNGDAVLGNMDCIRFIYNTTDDRYIETARTF